MLAPVLNMPISESRRQRVLAASCILYAEVSLFIFFASICASSLKLEYSFAPFLQLKTYISYAQLKLLDRFPFFKHSWLVLFHLMNFHPMLHTIFSTILFIYFLNGDSTMIFLFFIFIFKLLYGCFLVQLFTLGNPMVFSNVAFTITSSLSKSSCHELPIP